MKMLAAAKINLYLNVVGRRDDGYHEIETFYQPVSLWDELTIERVPSGIAVEGDSPDIPWNEDNLCYRAAELILEKAGCRRGVRIKLTKGIPPGAGLGGGSSDAAATLIGINQLYECGLSGGELRDLGGRIGSDVPFFVLGRPAIGRGRGEILEEAPGLRAGWILIVKPDATVSTKWAYRSLNLVLTMGSGQAKLAALLDGLQRFPDARLETYNSFENGIRGHFPSVSGILTTLKSLGPVLSSLSGSGSACFGVFAEESEARKAEEHFQEGGFFTRIVQPVEAAIRCV